MRHSFTFPQCYSSAYIWIALTLCERADLEICRRLIPRGESGARVGMPWHVFASEAGGGVKSPTVIAAYGFCNLQILKDN
jgi:hypothetical protein